MPSADDITKMRLSHPPASAVKTILAPFGDHLGVTSLSKGLASGDVVPVRGVAVPVPSALMV